MSAIDWRVPIKARAEERTEEIDGWADERTRHAILWHLNEEGYRRIQRLEACYHCLTTFPATPSRENMRYWEEAEKNGFKQVRGVFAAHRLIRERRCPTCGVPISREALRLNDWGVNPLNDRPAE